MRLEITTTPTREAMLRVRNGVHASDLTQVPILAAASYSEFNVVLREGQAILAGAACELKWGWLYFESVWTADSARGKGYGTHVMNAAETYALEQGIPGAYLMTTTFQAKPFYDKLGYTQFGHHADRPLGHAFYYMLKPLLAPQPIDPRITIEAPQIPETTDLLDNGLLADIEKHVPLVDVTLAVLLRDEGGTVQGGIVGDMFWDWFDLRFLWLHESVRGQGWESQMLTAVESAARTHGCIGVVTEVTSFQHLPLFDSHNYSTIATLADRPPGHSTHFLQKRF